MGMPTSGASYRVELMHLRERVAGSRGKYRFIAFLSGALTLFCFIDQSYEYRWQALCLGTLVTVASILAYRDVLRRPRFWSLVPLALWVLPVALGFLASLVGIVIDVFSGEFQWSSLPDVDGENLFALLFWLSVTETLRSAVPTREEVCLIEQHREEWDSYSTGRASVKRAQD